MLEIIYALKDFVVSHVYLFLFLGTFFEGLNTIVLAGFLASFEKVLLSATFPLLLFAHILNGYAWYLVGRKSGDFVLRRFGGKKGVEKTMERIGRYFDRYSGRAVILSKFTLGFEIATLTLAGSLKYNFKKFSLYNAVGSLGWVSMTLFVGYFFGQSFKFFFTAIKNISLAIVFLAIAIALIYIFALFLKRHYKHYLQMRERVHNLGGRFADRWDKLFGE